MTTNPCRGPVDGTTIHLPMSRGHLLKSLDGLHVGGDGSRPRSTQYRCRLMLADILLGLPSMFELAKILGALAWIVGIILIFAGNGGSGIVVLLIALFITVAASAETRKRREENLVETTAAAAANAAAGAVSKQSTTSDRLAEIEKLKASSQITEDEYQAKRRAILDGL